MTEKPYKNYHINIWLALVIKRRQIHIPHRKPFETNLEINGRRSQTTEHSQYPKKEKRSE
jgi:hypothetical protein